VATKDVSHRMDVEPRTARDVAAAMADRGSAPNGSKLASVVADLIVGDIARRGWPVGEVIGSEPELLDRYQVSRAVFREAVRLVEHQGAARMRRGPGGGLVVTLPGVGSVTDAVTVYLYYVGAEVDEVFEARLVLEETAAELAPSRLDEPSITALRDLVERERSGAVTDHRELHTLVAAITGNPALAFFVDLLNRVTLLYLPTPKGLAAKTLAESAHAHAAIAEAIIAGDEALARNRMGKHLRAEGAFLKRRRPSKQRLAVLPDVDDGKRGEAPARLIFQDVTTRGWPVGELLGSEAALMEQYDVSRAVLREAVRVLEYQQIARMRRGPGGGLLVTAPGAEATTDAVALLLDRRGITPDALYEVREAVEMAVLDRVIAQLDDESIERMRVALEAERSASRIEFAVVGHDLHLVLAAVAGNRVLELLTQVLVRLTRFHGAAPEGAPDPMPSQDVTHVHDRIVEAIIAGDPALARHRMRKHLEALRRWVR
jgi:DNA-binding FadR family transcriptional regulator